MTTIPITVDVVLDSSTRQLLEQMAIAEGRMADALLTLTQVLSVSRFTYSVEPPLEEDMPTYKADRPDFTVDARITARDSEGHLISNAPIPAGHTYTVESDNPDCITATQDPQNPKRVTYHIGGPNEDETPSQAIVTARLTDPAGNLVGTGASQVTVTVGDPTVIVEIDLNLPEE